MIANEDKRLIIVHYKVNVMIKSLDDFKTATRRIPKILNTFDLTKPDAFKLSNSAALNLMARILGYENYNTIKPVFEKKALQGINSMKYIKLPDGLRLNAIHLVKWFPQNGRNEIVLISSDESACYMDFKVKHSDHMTIILDKIDDFMQNDEICFDFESLYSTLQNTDNHANQLNPNQQG
jgi:hypothetical protein